jgi:pimeloyl-ACP methyl ester carboxylesterase
VDRLFIPGFGAPARLYRPALSDGWTALEAPSFRRTRGELAAYRGWLDSELERRDHGVWLAGHSFGGALAILAAAARPERVTRLTLISPAGLPLQKPLSASLADFVRQLASGVYSPLVAADALARAAVAPRAALRLARTVRALDLVREMTRVRASDIPVDVVGCATDTLVSPSHCRRQAGLLGAHYHHLPALGGHMWMLSDPASLAAALSAT